MAIELNARFFLVGYDGCPRWQRVMFFEAPGNRWYSPDGATLEGPAVEVHDIVVRCEQTGREWRVPVDKIPEMKVVKAG